MTGSHMASQSEIRKWAVEQELDVPKRGKVPQHIVDLFDVAHADHPLDGEVPDDEVSAEQEYEKDPDPKRDDSVSLGQVLKTPPKVTSALKKDIRAKLCILLGLPAAGFKLRDPVCGQAAVESIPDIADALTDIVCDSPDMVAFFTSGAGGFMKWLALATALQPLAVTVWGHHISHSIGEKEHGHEDWSQYDAPDFIPG